MAHPRLTAALVVGMLAAQATMAIAAGASQPGPQDLGKLTLEQLLDLDVTLATRRPEPIGEIAAAISVIRREDLRRSGVTTIADALALADGVYVGRFNNGAWAIGARGFTGSSPNKLLVMIDGRSVYSELLTGVLWNTVDYVLEDIDRIEVIRGPGATLWGANAVNGVINIVTRNSRETQGAFVQVGAGNESHALAEARYGGTAGDLTTWRVYGKFGDRSAQQFSTGISADDPSRHGQAGLRIDGGRPDGDNWMVKADAFHSRESLIDRPAGEFTDLSAQARWSHAFAASRLDVQSFYRHEYRRVVRQLTHRLDTADVELQHSFVTAGHQIVWGADARFNRDRTFPSGVVFFEPEARSYPLFSAFAQDEFPLRRDRLFLTVGAKLEHNAFSGADLQPNVRSRLRVGDGWLWGAVSRAVRRPTRFDDDISLTLPTGTVLIRGNDDFRSESLVAYEAGYRVQPRPFLSADVALFAHRFDDLRSQDSPPTVIPALIGNTLNGRSSGVELGVNVQPVNWWRTHATYTWLDMSLTRDADSSDLTGGASEANDPPHMFGLRSSFDLPGRVEVDAMLRAIGALPDPVVPGYTELNLRLGWRWRPQVEFAVVGQDLLHAQHPESGTAVPRREEFQRSVRGVLTLRLP